MQEKTHKKSLVKQNILHYIEYKGITKYLFYKNTGITRGILDQETGISEDNLARFIAQYREVNVEWLLTGNGNMLLKDPQPSYIVAEPSGKYESCKMCQAKDEIISALKEGNAALRDAVNLYKSQNQPENKPLKETLKGNGLRIVWTCLSQASNIVFLFPPAHTHLPEVLLKLCHVM